MDLAALYERIVSLVPVEELQDGYNAALSEDISPLKRAVDDVTAAFAKLEEVRDAVHKLEGVNGSTTSRSPSLVEVLDGTMTLQRQLKEKVEATLALMTRKEKRTQQHDEERETKRIKAEKTPEINERSPKREREYTEKPNRDEAKPEPIPLHFGSETQSEGSSWVNKLSETKCLEVLRMMTQLSVPERNKHIPGVLSKLETILPCQIEREQISTLKYMILWAHLSIGQGGDSGPFLRVANTVTDVINRLPHAGSVGLQRLNKTLLDLVQRGKVGKEHAKPNASAQLSYDLQVWRVKAMATKERRKHVHQIVSALEGEMTRKGDLVLNQQFEMAKAVKILGRWAPRDCRSPNLLRIYTGLAEHVRAYAGRVKNFAVKTELLRETRSLELAVGNVDDESAQAKAERVLTAVNRLPQNCSAEDVGEWILKLDEVIYHHEKGWKPRTNPIVCQCYQQLLQRAEVLKGTAQRQRVVAMKKWKIRQPQ